MTRSLAGLLRVRFLLGCSLIVAGVIQSAQVAPIRVALYKGPGTAGKGPPNLMRLLENQTSTITQVTPQEIRDGCLTNYDVVIFAGGSASKQAQAIAEAGRETVRQFIGHGGGYIGICAGAYLATSGFSWGLHVINARTISPKWMRGVGDVKMELTSPGRKVLGDRTGEFTVHYANGPIVMSADEASLPPYETLACFRTELAKNGSPVGVMVNSPAFFSANFKRGRVLCISPHPEQTEGLQEFVTRSVDWVASKPRIVTITLPRMKE